MGDDRRYQDAGFGRLRLACARSAVLRPFDECRDLVRRPAEQPLGGFRRPPANSQGVPEPHPPILRRNDSSEDSSECLDPARWPPSQRFVGRFVGTAPSGRRLDVAAFLRKIRWNGAARGSSSEAGILREILRNGFARGVGVSSAP
jgi:hypothetical protein